MLRKQYLFIILAFLSVAAVIVAVPKSPAPEISPQREFETKYTLSGLFRDFFDTYGGLRIFGNPITATFMENGRRVQYFQNVCLELTETTEGYIVRLCPLGLRANPEKAGTSSDDTSFEVGYDFVAFYNRYGGDAFFGPPISRSIRYPDGRVEQYFLNALLTYNRAEPNPQVRIAPLGDIYVTTNSHNMDPMAFVSTMNATVDDIGGLHVVLNVEHPLCDPSFLQLVKVTVTRIDGEPAEYATVDVWFTDVNGMELPDTRRTHHVNEQGYAQIPIQTPEGKQGDYIFVNVEASYTSVPPERETTFFQIWKIR